jgi:hypothetical protein
MDTAPRALVMAEIRFGTGKMRRPQTRQGIMGDCPEKGSGVRESNDKTGWRARGEGLDSGRDRHAVRILRDQG